MARPETKVGEMGCLQDRTVTVQPNQDAKLGANPRARNRALGVWQMLFWCLRRDDRRYQKRDVKQLMSTGGAKAGRGQLAGPSIHAKPPVVFLAAEA